MAKYTKNYNLEKQQNNEYISIDGLNNNFDKIDKVLGNTGKFESAGGTATAIILSDVILEDGAGKTFKVTSGNEGASTTINGKKLYKPGTTTAPTLIAGKAVTIWYDEAGDCFFFKASAEGNASVGDVLAGKTFSNDSDTGLAGTMVNRGAMVIIPGTTNKTIEQGYHNGSGYVKGDANLIPANIKSGTTIFDVVGTMAAGGYYNFPLSIQVSQPTAVKNGHIWIKSSATFIKIEVVDTFTVGATDGTLMFVVGDTFARKETISHTMKTTDNKSLTVSTSEISDSSADWLVSNLNDGVNTSIMLRRPMVYSKLGGVLDVETAYMWNGSSWQLISQKGSYLEVTASGITRIFNVVGDNYTLNYNNSFASTSHQEKFSGNGRFFYVSCRPPKVLLRNGDVFSDYFTAPQTIVLDSRNYVTSGNGVISGDGNTLAIEYRSSGYSAYICIFTSNGTSFINTNNIKLSGNNPEGVNCIDLNYTGTAIAVSQYYNTPLNYWEFIVYFKNSDGSYSRNSVASNLFRPAICKFSRDHSKILVPVSYKDGANMFLNVYTFNEQSKTVSIFRSFPFTQKGGGSGYYSQITSSNNGLVFLGDTVTDNGYAETLLYDYNNNIGYATTGLTRMQDGNTTVELSADGTRLARACWRSTTYNPGVSLFGISLNSNTKVATFTLLKKITEESASYDSLRYFP